MQNIDNAFNILGVNKETSLDDIKGKYRQLAKQYHPDVNKEPDAESKFKEVTAAFELIKEYKENPSKFDNTNPFAGFGGWPGGAMNFEDLFTHFHPSNSRNRSSRQVKHISINLNLTFKESVLGAKKHISYKREAKCTSCNGDCRKKVKNDCQHCDGFGKKTTKFGSNIYGQETCRNCYGKNVTHTSCKDCKDGVKIEDFNVDVMIPAGVTNNQVLRLGGVGNFGGMTIMGEANSDVLITVNVDKHKTLYLEDKDVICNVKVDLLDALKGKKIKVDTINGEKDIKIPVLAKNKDVVELAKLGCPNGGVQKCIIEIVYPSDEKLEKLIEILSISEESK